MKKKSALKFTIIFFLVILLMLSFGLLIYSLTVEKIDLNLVKSGATSITKIYYFNDEDRRNRNGIPIELKEEELFQYKHDWISIEDIPQNLINSFVAIEDKRFYQHKGVDWKRTIKAIFNYLFKFENKNYGGSSITQQLVKNITGKK